MCFLVLEMSLITINSLIVWKKYKTMYLLTLTIGHREVFVYRERSNSPNFNTSYQ